MIPKYIILHHSLTVDSKTKSAEAIKRYHIETMGWKDIGYHHLIELVDKEYKIFKGREDNVAGAHTRGMNINSLGICCVGNYDKRFMDEDMFDLLADLVFCLCLKYMIPIDNIRRHNDYAPYKTCPGKYFPFDKLIKTIYNKIVKADLLDLDTNEFIIDFMSRKINKISQE